MPFAGALLNWMSDIAAALSSSSSMVPVAAFAAPSAAFDDGLESVTVKVSSSSFTRSLPVAMEMVAEVDPALIVNFAPLVGAV